MLEKTHPEIIFKMLNSLIEEFQLHKEKVEKELDKLEYKTMDLS